MAKRIVKTFEDARAALIELLPDGCSMYLTQEAHDQRRNGKWWQSIEFSVRIYSEDFKDSRSVSACTPAELVSKFVREVLPAISKPPVAARNPPHSTHPAATVPRSAAPAIIRTAKRPPAATNGHRPLNIEQRRLLIEQEPEDFGGD